MNSEKVAWRGMLANASMWTQRNKFVSLIGLSFIIYLGTYPIWEAKASTSAERASWKHTPQEPTK